MKAAYVNHIFGTIVLSVLLVGTGAYGARTLYLLTPPSDITKTVAASLRDHPEEWVMGPVAIILTNKTRKLEITQFGNAGSTKVTMGTELVPTLDNNMNVYLSSNNQNYLNRAIKDWMRATYRIREQRMIEEIGYEP